MLHTNTGMLKIYRQSTQIDRYDSSGIMLFSWEYVRTSVCCVLLLKACMNESKPWHCHFHKMSTSFLIWHHFQNHRPGHYRSLNVALPFLAILAHTAPQYMWRDQLWVWCCMSYYCYIIKCISPAMNVDKVCTYSSDYWCHKSVRFNGCPLLNSRAIFIDTRYCDSRTIFIDTRYCDSRTIFIDTPYTIVYVGQYFDVVA